MNKQVLIGTIIEARGRCNRLIGWVTRSKARQKRAARELSEARIRKEIGGLH